MVTVIDIDMGNAGSVINMIKKVGGSAVLTRDKKVISNAKKLILPGDGAFDTGMDHIRRFGLLELLNKLVLEKKIPFLGVCVGMQILSKSSEEGKKEGLGWIKAKTIRFRLPDSSLRIPHMGWNKIKVLKKSILLKNLPKDARFYFVHSYHLQCEDTKDIISTTNYGYDFASAVQRQNIYGVQFHPEKSHKFGMKIYANFIKL